jgi:methyl-accepting chemotaxis protein/carbonic anhydrase
VKNEKINVKWMLGFMMLLFTCGGSAFASGGGAHWGYNGHEGPANWGDLAPEYAVCKTGLSQSPINIDQTIPADLAAIQFAYQEVPLKIVNNGHTVQVNYPAGSSIVADGKSYQLLQFHFHSPSENVRQGSAYPLEMHLVHKASDGQLGVVGVFFEEGAPNPVLEQIWRHLPTQVGHEQQISGKAVNAALLLPRIGSYYHFDGSLTTPPCSEGVKWYVMQNPLSISRAQVEKFLGLVSENARPAQPLHSRPVKAVYHAQTALIPVAKQYTAATPATVHKSAVHEAAPAHASPTSGHAAATAGNGDADAHGHGGGHAEFENVAAKPIVLVAKNKLNELDANRHRAVKAEAVELNSEGGESSLAIVFVLAAVLLIAGGLYMRSDAFINRRLGFKLGVGFSAMILLALSIGLGSYYYMDDINNKYDLALSALELNMMSSELNSLQYAFVLHGIEDKARGEESRKEIEELLVEFDEDIDAILAHDLEKDEIAVLEHIDKTAGDYKKSFAHLVEKYHAIEKLKEELDEAGETIGHELTKIIHKHEKELEELEVHGAASGQLTLQTKLVETLFEAEILELKLAHAEVEFLLDKHIERVAAMEADLSELYAVLGTIKNIIPLLDTPTTEQRADLAMIADVEAVLHHFQKQLGEVIVDELLVESDLIDLTADVVDIEMNSTAFAERMDHEAEATKEQADQASMMLMALALLIGGLVSYSMTRSITRPVAVAVEMIEDLEKGHVGKRGQQTSQDEIGMMVGTMNRFAESLQTEMVANLLLLAKGDLTFDIEPRDDQDEIRKAIKKLGIDINEIVGQIQISGEQISSGSSQVASTSESLSQGATEQASSLEEISASLNQMSSQTSTNAENATQANLLATEAKDAAEKGSNQMQSMVTAMTEINEAGQNIGKIIKVIDEIAFQTNLLALNAAVEAARAGQHGKGFAVVAEEVRNLAARSAEAAAETAELIEGSVAKTENGSAIANQTAEALQEIVGGIGKVSDLVNEIAAASNEQAQGVSQISQGVSQVDTVTQQNTANAEEGAAAAEELSGQAEQLQRMLQRFIVKKEQQHQRSADRMPATRQSSISWQHMPLKPQSAPVESTQISLNDS